MRGGVRHAMSTPAATAYVDMKPDFSGFNREVASKLGPIAKNFGGQFGKALEPVMNQQAKHLRTFATGAKYAAAGGAALAVVVGKDIVTAGMKFEKQVSVNTAISEASRKEQAKLERQSLKLGKATFFSASEAAEAQGELVKGGLEIQQVLGGGLPAALRLAEAGELELATAAETTVNAMKLFGLEGKEAGSVADMLSTAANRTTADVLDFAMALKQGGSVTKLAGYEMNETVTVLEALAEAGIKNSDAGTSMKTAVIQLLKPSTKQAELAKELNLHFVSQEGHLKSAAGLSKELHRVTDDMTKAEKAKVLATLAGTDGVRTLNALVSETPKELRALEQANARQGTAQDIATKKMDNFAGTWEQFKGTLETVEIQIYKGAAPALEDLTEEATQAAARVGAVFENPNLSGGEKVEQAISVLQDELGRIWDRNGMSEHLLDALDYALDTVVPHVAENAGELGVTAAKGFVHGFTHADLLGKVVMGAWLLNFIGGKAAFVGLGRGIGKQFGVSFATSAAAEVAGGTAASGLASAIGGAAAPRWLGTDSAAQRARLRAAGIGSLGRQTERQALAAQGGIFRNVAGGAAGAGGMSLLGAAAIPAAIAGLGIHAALTETGEDWGNSIADGISESVEENLGPRLAKAMESKSPKRLEALRQDVQQALSAAIASGASDAAVQPLRDKLQALDLRIDNRALGIHPNLSRDAATSLRRQFKQTMLDLSVDASAGMGEINKDLARGLQATSDLFSTGTKPWRAHTAEAMTRAVHAIETGMQLGTISTAQGQKEINRLLREIHLVKGDDPFGLAKATVKSFQETNGVTATGVKAWLNKLDQMPRGAAKKSIESTQGMLRAWAEGHPKLEHQIEALTSYQIRKFGATNKQLREGVRQDATGPIADAFREAAMGVGGALENIGTNTSQMLKLLGLKDIGEFQALVFGPNRAPQTRGAQSKSEHNHPQIRQEGGVVSGTFIVPGSGSGDTFRTALPPGSFIENRNAVRDLPSPFQDGGLVPVALEPGERGYLPDAVRQIGLETLKARNAAVSRFQAGGEVRVSGPGVVGRIGYGALKEVTDGINSYFEEHPGGLGTMGVRGSVGHHPELQPGISAIAATILQRWPGLSITSTTGGGHATNSLHYSGRAVDLGGSLAYMLQAAAWIKANLGAQLTEGIHNPNLSIKYGKEVSSDFWGSAVWGDHVDHIHAGKQLGGLIGYFAKGGSLGENFQKKAQRVWGASASLYGKAGTALPPMHLRDLAGRAGLVYEDQTGVLIDRDWAQKFLRGDDGAESMVPHEWAHMFQDIAKVQATWEREGGAEAFARWADPQIYGALGEPFHYRNITPGYGAYARQVVAEKGWDWVKHGQFKQPGGLIQMLASGGFVDASASQKDVALQVGRELLRRGLNYKGAAGVIGNAWRESLWNAASIGTGGRGLWGFDFYEQQLLEAAEKQGIPWTSVPFQTDFMWSGPEPASDLKGALNSQSSAAAAAKFFDTEWERSGVKAMSDRMNGAREAMRLMTGSDMESGGRGDAHLPAEVGYHEKGGVTGGGGGTSAPAKGKVKTEKLSDFGALPDTIPGVQRELIKRRSELSRYRAALRSNKDPEVKRALEVNINLLRNRIQALKEQRDRLLHKKAQEAVTKKISKRGTLPGFEEAIASAERAYEAASEEAQQIVSLEPEEGPQVKAYIEGREAPAWAKVLGTEAHWRNALLAGEGAAAARLRELEAQQERLNALKVNNPKAFNQQKFRLPAIRQAIAAIKSQYTPPQAKSLQDLEAGRFAVVAGGEFENSLVSLQGIGKSTVPMDVLPSEPVAGSFGGLIFDTQMSIRELGLKLNQAGETGGEDNSELLATIREIAERERRGRYVSERLSATSTAFDNAYPNGAMPPYAGKAHSGAIVPGPPTEERTMILRGQERIRTPEQELAMARAIREGGGYGGGMPIVETHVHGDIVTDRDDPVETVLRDPRTKRVIQRTRGGRVTAGGARR